MKIVVIHGPNLNMLGKRPENHYGSFTLQDLEGSILEHIQRKDANAEVFFYQSNSEGTLIDTIHQHIIDPVDAIIINPGAYAHYSYAIHDALEISQATKIEVHLSDVHNREGFRAQLVTGMACDKTFSGGKEQSYRDAIDWLYTQKKLED